MPYTSCSISTKDCFFWNVPLAQKALLALALCFILILQSAAFINIRPAEAQSAWTGTIETQINYTYGEFDGKRTVEIKRGGDFSFTVAKGDSGDVVGQGKGWEEYTQDYTSSDGSGDCPTSHDNGRTDVTFSLSGFVDSTGKLYLDFRNISPIDYTVYRGCVGRYDSEGYDMHTFDSWSANGADMDLQDGAVYTQPDHGVPGYDRLVIHGSASPKTQECPALTITPTMPPASDPRNLARPTDTASYRLQVTWEGSTPVKVNFGVQGGSDSINPSFVFNPANMVSSPISVLMDVDTRHAMTGEYPLTVDAWVVDPDTGQECHAESAANVVLVVSEESPANNALPLIGKVEDKQGVAGIHYPHGDGTFGVADPSQGLKPGAEIKTGIDGNLGISSDNGETVKVGRDSTVGTGAITSKSDGEELEADLPANWQLQFAPEAPPLIDKEFWQEVGSQIIDAHKELGGQMIEGAGACLTAGEEAGALAVVECFTRGIYLLYNGYAFVTHEEMIEPPSIIPGEGHLWITPSAAIVPLSTKFSVVVTPDNSTTITTIKGPVLVMDLKSKNSVVMGDDTQLTIPKSGSGMSQEELKRGITSLDPASIINDWWSKPVNQQFEIGDYGTFKNWPSDSGPVNRTTVFSDQDNVFTYVKFLSVLPPEHTVVFKFYWPDGSLFWNTTQTLEAVDPQYSGWSYYPVGGGHFDLKRYHSDRIYGQWRIDVYADNQLVKQMSFYVVKNTLVNGQSAKYAFNIHVNSDDEQVRAAFENILATSFSQGIAGTESTNVKTPNDIEWLKATVIKDSEASTKIQPELKIRNQPTAIKGEQTNLVLDSNSSMLLFVPTKGIDKDYTIRTNFGEGFPSQLVLGSNVVDINLGGSTVKAYEFSGSKKLTQGASSADVTIMAHYEKYTGMLVDLVLSGKLVDPQIGKLEFDFGLNATEMNIPTTLTVSSFPSQIQQNQDLKISGTVVPAINSEGQQVLLTYERVDSNNSSEEPIKRTASVVNGTFSDSYKIEKSGTYSVSAMYLGSGILKESKADPQQLTVTPSGCLIATAAFGSELTPQVQFLRSFRDNHILSTAAGSSFMNVFNAWYYSFSPSVADYERQQPWLQTAVRAAIYPLLGILTVSEKAYASMPGEYGAVTAGVIASSMIGAVYFWPAVFAVQRFNRPNKRMSHSLAIALIGIAVAAAVISVIAANPAALMVTTSFLVLSIVVISALFSARLIRYATNRIIRK